MRLRTVFTAGLVASVMTLTTFGGFSASAQSTPAAVQIAQAKTDDPAIGTYVIVDPWQDTPHHNP